MFSSPAQPLNLSLSATDVPLPPSPTEPSGDPAYPSPASVQSVAPATPGHPHTGPKLVTVKAEPLDPYQQGAEVSSQIFSH